MIILISRHLDSGVREVCMNGKQEEAGENVVIIKSCIKRKLSPSFPHDATKELVNGKKKRVQWVDHILGKELAEIREFESSETGDTDSRKEESSSCCLCVIL